MLDQMFTAENFRRIFDIENRRGNDLGKKFFPSVATVSQKIKEKIAELKVLRSQKSIYNSDVFLVKEQSLLQEIKKLKDERSAIVDSELEKVCLTASDPNFKINLTQKNGPANKPLYTIDSAPETFFIVKQLQSNIYRLYKVKQANRHDLASQLKNTLQSKFPFEIVRTDISSFYESVNRAKLIKKLDEDQLLSSASKKVIKQILHSYGAISNSDLGIPRGVGISAYLAELYMRSIDHEIKSIPGLILYCRYVDDIVAVFARPSTGVNVGKYENLVINAISQNELTHNPIKTHEVIIEATPNYSFDYLGYEYKSENQILKILPSSAKLSKIEARLIISFEAYSQLSNINSKKSFRELVSRIKFLTGNSRLVNSKSSATTGIYYNNPLVTEISSFESLDVLLKNKIELIKRKTLRTRLKKFKFTVGFQERHFHNFSSQELENIVKAWKYV